MNHTSLEPDDRSYDKLINKNNCYKYKIFKKIVSSSKSKIKYNFFEGWEQSSNYKPNLDFTSMLPENKIFNLARTDIIEVDTIDNVINKQIDFIKIDAQGAELEIIKGAKK